MLAFGASRALPDTQSSTKHVDVVHERRGNAGMRNMTDTGSLADLLKRQIGRSHENELIRLTNPTALMGRIIKWITIIAGAIALVVVISVVILALADKKIPDQLSNWGGVILGFYFGQFVTILKDYTVLAGARPSSAFPSPAERGDRSSDQGPNGADTTQVGAGEAIATPTAVGKRET
jgi:hypothetical protein